MSPPLPNHFTGPVGVGPVEASMRAQAVAARRRLFGGAEPRPATPPVRMVPVVPPPSIEVDCQVIQETEQKPAIPLPQWRVILNEVSRKYNVPVAAIIGASRTRSFLPARRECAYRMVVEAGMSYPAAGRRLNRDHSTVIHSIEKHLEAHPELRFALDDKQQAEREARLTFEDEVVHLYFEEELSPSDIAERLSVTRSVVQGIVHREVMLVRAARKAAAE